VALARLGTTDGSLEAPETANQMSGWEPRLQLSLNRSELPSGRMGLALGLAGFGALQNASLCLTTRRFPAMGAAP